jgi:hypothetical protein
VKHLGIAFSPVMSLDSEGSAVPFAAQKSAYAVMRRLPGLVRRLLGPQDKLSYDIALMLGIGLSILFRYWSCRTWVWRARGACRA